MISITGAAVWIVKIMMYFCFDWKKPLSRAPFKKFPQAKHDPAGEGLIWNTAASFQIPSKAGVHSDWLLHRLGKLLIFEISAVCQIKILCSFTF